MPAGQVCPIPDALAGKVATAFSEQGAQEGYDFEDEQDVLDAQDIKENYLRIELPDGSTMVHLLKPGKRFDLQWARYALRLLGSILAELDADLLWLACWETQIALTGRAVREVMRKKRLKPKRSNR